MREGGGEGGGRLSIRRGFEENDLKVDGWGVAGERERESEKEV